MRMCDAQCMAALDCTAALKSWVEKGQYNFRAHCQHQEQYYTAVAHMFEARRVSGLAEEGVYGKEIAWLKSASGILSGLASSKTKLVPTLQTHRKSLLKKLSPRLREALKDNSDIYHDPIPSVTSLRAIPSRQNVKVTPYELRRDAVAYPFKDMVPKAVAKRADTLKQEIQAEAQTPALQCNENNDNARAILASLGLPAAVDAVQSGAGSGLPDAVWARLSECAQIGGAAELAVMYSRIEAINKESWAILQNEIIAALDREQAIDAEIRGKLGAKWQRSASGDLQKEYRGQVEVIANHLTTAIETNSKIEASMAEHAGKFACLDKSRVELAGELPSVEEAKDNEEAEQLKALLDELSALIGRRDELRGEYEAEVAALDLAQLCMQNEAASAETVKKLARMSLEEMAAQLEAEWRHSRRVWSASRRRTRCSWRARRATRRKRAGSRCCTCSTRRA